MNTNTYTLYRKYQNLLAEHRSIHQARIEKARIESQEAKSEAQAHLASEAQAHLIRTHAEESEAKIKKLEHENNTLTTALKYVPDPWKKCN